MKSSQTTLIDNEGTCRDNCFSAELDDISSWSQVEIRGIRVVNGRHLDKPPPSTHEEVLSVHLLHPKATLLAQEKQENTCSTTNYRLLS